MGHGDVGNTKKPGAGFTIVELLVVIVVIAILAAITIVAYNGIQARARDARRIQDIANIKKALLAYDAVNGGVKRVTAYNAVGGTHGGWDVSIDPNWLSFLRASNNLMPVDPANTMPVTSNGPDAANRVYFYYCYTAGAGPLPATDNVRLGYIVEGGTIKSENFPVTSCLSS
jgi:prepilin-type N-terminal cleavage/methylation domain-containing protein